MGPEVCGFQTRPSGVEACSSGSPVSSIQGPNVGQQASLRTGQSRHSLRRIRHTPMTQIFWRQPRRQGTTGPPRPGTHTCASTSSTSRARRSPTTEGWPEQWRAGAEGGLRRDHRRGRRARARHGLLHGQGTWADQHRRPRQGMARGRQHRAQHDDHPLQLSVGGVRSDLRARAETLGDLSQELNYNVMYSPRGVMMLAHNTHDVQVFKRHVHANRLAGIDNEWLSAEEAKAFCPILNISTIDPLSRHRRGPAAARRDGASRRGRLGLRARRLGARRRHPAELRGDRHPPRRQRRRLGRRDDARLHRDQEDRRRRGRPHVASCSAWPACACRSRAIRCRRSFRARKTHHALRRNEQHDPRLHVAIGQGRNRDRRRHRRLLLVFADRRTAHRHHTLDAICELFPTVRRLRMLRNWGGIVDVTPDRSPIIGKTPFRACSSIAAGARAASRRRRARAMCLLTRSRRANRTRSPRRSRSTVSAPAV